MRTRLQRDAALANGFRTRTGSAADDFWREFNQMCSVGVKFVRQPKEPPYGTVAVFEDLYGILWDLSQIEGRGHPRDNLSA